MEGEQSVERDGAMCFQVVQVAIEPVWLFEKQLTVAKDERTAAEPELMTHRYLRSRNRPLQRSRRSRRRDVEKLTEEDVDDMILETDVDDEIQQTESESDAVTDIHGVPPEDVSTVTVEVEQTKIKTVVKCMENGDFYSHERPVCVLKPVTSEWS